MAVRLPEAFDHVRKLWTIHYQIVKTLWIGFDSPYRSDSAKSEKCTNFYGTEGWVALIEIFRFLMDLWKSFKLNSCVQVLNFLSESFRNIFTCLKTFIPLILWKFKKNEKSFFKEKEILKSERKRRRRIQVSGTGLSWHVKWEFEHLQIFRDSKVCFWP